MQNWNPALSNTRRDAICVNLDFLVLEKKSSTMYRVTTENGQICTTSSIMNYNSRFIEYFYFDREKCMHFYATILPLAFLSQSKTRICKLWLICVLFSRHEMVTRNWPMPFPTRAHLCYDAAYILREELNLQWWKKKKSMPRRRHRSLRLLSKILHHFYTLEDEDLA